MTKRTFEQALYKYKAFMADSELYRSGWWNTRYVCEDNSHQDEHGNWCLCDEKDRLVCFVSSKGQVKLA